MDIWIIKETCLDRDYLWGEALQPEWSVVDIGAGLGDFSVLAGKECPQGIVHAYEPLAGSFALLEANLALNGLDNVRAFPEGVAAAAGQLAVSSPNARPVSTRFGRASGPAAVPAVTLAAVLDRLPDGRCDFLKIDCEGCEFDLLLQSSADVLARIGRVSLEAHEGYASYRTAELATWLREHGFVVRQRPNPVHRSLSLLFAERQGSIPAA
jgi:FkbM family methyltransferase